MTIEYIIATVGPCAVFETEDDAYEAVHALETDNLAPAFIRAADGVRVYLWNDTDIVAHVGIKRDGGTP